MTALAFLAAYLAGVVFAFVRHPVYGLLTYLGVFFLHPPSRWWGQGFLSPFRWALMSSAITLVAVLVSSSKLERPGRPFLAHGIMALLLLFIAWLGIQSFWAMVPEEQSDLLSYFLKFVVMLYLFYRCVQTEDHVRLVLWTYVLGCFYFGLIAFTSYSGGRFEGFGGPGVNEANAAALTVVIGIFFAAALFLDGGMKTRIALMLVMPFVVNALVTTISRSGFLALCVGGLVFNLYSPPKWRARVRLLSVLGLAGFVALTGPAYWNRMQTLKHAGAEVEVVKMDTGEDRVEIMRAQARMFGDHPLGCGAMCTAALSPQYMDEKYLTDNGSGSGVRQRASHNTFFSMLVEHGIPGVTFYCFMLLWLFLTLRRISQWCRESVGLMSSLYPSIAAIAVAMTVGDMFVSYVKYEIRFWFLMLLMIMVSMWRRAAISAAGPASAGALVSSSGPGPSAATPPREAGPKRRVVAHSRPLR